MIHAIAQTNFIEDPHGHFFARLWVNARVNERQLDIAQTCRARQQVKRLEDKSDLAISDCGQLVIVHLGDIAAVEFVAPGRRRIETPEHIHES